MMKFLLSILGCVVLSAVPTIAGGPKVQAALLADVSTIQPGQSFTAGVWLTIPPKNHVYWSNPGDSGMATRVRFKLPDGFKSSDLMFPAPTRFDLPGGIANFGYEDEILLLTTITAPPDLKTPTEISADVEWLVCDDRACISEKATGLMLKLPTASSPNSDLFDRFKAQLPATSERAKDVARIILNSGTVEVQWTTTPKDIQFFPPADEYWSFENIAVQTTGKTTRVQFELKSQSVKCPPPPRPILAYTVEGVGRRAVELSVSPNSP